MSIALVALTFLLVPLLAGGIVHRVRPDGRWLKLLLSASGSFLLGVVFLHMLPELYGSSGAVIGIWVLAGFLVQAALEPASQGIEHGHFQAHGRSLPAVAMFSLCLHAFLEGMPFAEPKVASNIPFLAGVVLHKVPMAMALAAILLRSGWERSRAWAALVGFSLAAPSGIGIGLLVGESFGSGPLEVLLAVAIGMLLHIGTTIIFESAPGHRMDKGRFMAVVLGMGLAALLSMH
jgi:zinc transporter ZupT